MWNRRQMLSGAGAAALLGPAVLAAESRPRPRAAQGYTPVETPNVSKLPYVLKDGVKEFRLVAQAIERELAPGTTVRAWGYNGSTPGPTIECVEGDRIRVLVTNELPEPTTVHWHGVLLPSGMDGVGGLSQPPIPPGETWAYEFTLRQHGTFLYHPHADEMVQMALGMMGFLIVHPRDGEEQPVDRDFALLPHEWALHPGTWRPDPAVMLDFNLFTFNGRVFPGTDPLVVRTGERVRIRLGNLSMNQHPVHLHGYSFQVTATDGGTIPPSARWPQTTVPVPVGSTRDIRFTADAPGDWALHCHKSHHTMNAMGHELPNLIGVDQGALDGRPDLEARIRALLPGYRAMGRDGMSEHARHLPHLRGPRNTLPMMGGEGPYGSLEMGGMFTVLKVRDELTGYGDPGWYRPPAGTQAYRVG
jgi:FtsP/CotA-like multicopper oxidase with cupredoxin domain